MPKGNTKGGDGYWFCILLLNVFPVVLLPLAYSVGKEWTLFYGGWKIFVFDIVLLTTHHVVVSLHLVYIMDTGHFVGLLSFSHFMFVPGSFLHRDLRWRRYVYVLIQQIYLYILRWVLLWWCICFLEILLFFLNIVCRTRKICMSAFNIKMETASPIYYFLQAFYRILILNMIILGHRY